MVANLDARGGASAGSTSFVMSLRVTGSQRSDQVLDHILSTLTQEEQRELLDALAGEIDERLDTVVETADS